MSWHDEFQQGSFRGAAFLIRESADTFGRRNQVNEYPGRELPYVKDLGRSADTWTVDCLVIGDDYMTARDALKAACRAPGPGTLIHPYLGTLSVTCGVASSTESTENGGMATFSIPFTEAGQNQTPAATTDTQAGATAAAASVQTASAASVAANLQVGSTAPFVTTAAQGVLSGAGDALSGALAGVGAPPSALADVQAQIAVLASQGLSLLASPASLVEQVFSIVSAISAAAPYADDVLTQMTALLTWGSALPPVPGSTPSRMVQATNQQALAQLIQVAAAAEAVTTVAAIDFTSYDDAVSIRDPLADALDGVALAIADTGDDGLAGAVDALRLAMIADVTARGASLARLYAYTPAQTEPALVIAQRLYGDAERADEIVARNAIQHPSFVPGGLALEVLSDA